MKTNIEKIIDKSIKLALAAILALSLLSTIPRAFSQNIAWGSASGITGDNSLLTNGTYVDAFLTDVGVNTNITVDGIVFKAAISGSATSGSDGVISFAITSGNNNGYNFTTFPATPPSSPAFAAVMNSGGTYENGGAGSGTVTISGLIAGHLYTVQVFNYANDGDPGLTTLSGSTPVTLSNLPGSGGANTFGEYSTGTFTASGSIETFDWNGAGSGFTVLGPICVMDITSQSAPIISEDTTPLSVTAYLNSVTTFNASFIGVQPITNQWWVSTNGGATFQMMADETNTTLTLTNTVLETNVEYYLVAVNAYGTNHSSPASLTVIPVPPQNINWQTVEGITGDTNLLTNGVYFDALVPNTSTPGALTADGVAFNVAANTSGGCGDAFISLTASGLNNFRWPGTFPVGGAASSDFANLMDAGGVFQFGGAGTGQVLLTGLTSGHTYQVQVFNFAPDGDNGLTTLSGGNPPTLSNLPGYAGPNTYGEFVTGTFAATGPSEIFDWAGAGSSYTVICAISVRDISVILPPVALTIQSIGGGMVQITWPEDHLGWTLQQQTTVGAGGLGSSWVSVAGSTSVDVENLPVSTTNKCVFFRLTHP